MKRLALNQTSSSVRTEAATLQCKRGHERKLCVKLLRTDTEQDVAQQHTRTYGAEPNLQKTETH